MGHALSASATVILQVKMVMPASSIRGSLSLSATGSNTVNALQLTVNQVVVRVDSLVAFLLVFTVLRNNSELRSRLLVDGMLCNGLTVFQLETPCHFDTRSVPRRTDYYGDDFRKTFPYSAPPTMASACAKRNQTNYTTVYVGVTILALCFLSAQPLESDFLFAVASSTFLHSHKARLVLLVRGYS